MSGPSPDQPSPGRPASAGRMTARQALLAVALVFFFGVAIGIGIGLGLAH